MTPSDARTRKQQGGKFFKDSVSKNPEEKKKSAAPDVLVSEHGKYQIKSGRLSGNFVARAFPKPPTKARGLIAEATGETEEAAIAALQSLIDARKERQVGERRQDTHSGAGIPSTDEYIEAICQVTLSRPQIAMLKALSLAGHEGLTEKRMAHSAGYTSVRSSMQSFARAGLLIANYLEVQTNSELEGTDLEGTSVLGYRDQGNGNADLGNWILHEELSHAVRSCT